MLHELDLLLLAILLVVLRHGELVRSDKVEGRVEVAHSRQEAVNRPAVLEVTDQIDVQVLQRSLSLVDGVEVEHRLAGVLIGSVTRIHDGHRRNLAGILGSSLQIVAHHDYVGIVRHHHDCVLQGLALCSAGHLGVGKTDDFRSKAIGRSLEAEARSCARLEEQSGNYSTLEKPAVGVLLELLRHTDEVLDFLARMVSDGYKTSTLHYFLIFLCKDSKKVHSS